MGARRFVNLAAEHLFRGMEDKQRIMIQSMLREPFDYELTPEQQARAERRRIAMQTGAYTGQAGLIGAFNLRPKES